MNLLTLIPLAMALAACSANSSGGTDRAAAQTDTSETAAASGRLLPLPAVPDTLRAPAERATFLLEHFWDAMDFADTALTRSEAFMEPNFVNFAALYPHADTTRLPGITARFLQKATADTPSRLLLYDLVDKYLARADSPVANDSTYITFLDQWVKLEGIDSYELVEPSYRLAAAVKNRVGSQAADFTFATADGRESTLAAAARKAPRVLVVFYDPDCDHCRETIARLRADSNLALAVTAGRLKVLAVYVGDDTELWHNDLPGMPADWTVAIDRSSVVDGELYDIPEMPGIYLVDGAMKVEMRNPSAARLEKKLAEIADERRN